MQSIVTVKSGTDILLLHFSSEHRCAPRTFIPTCAFNVSNIILRNESFEIWIVEMSDVLKPCAIYENEDVQQSQLQLHIECIDLTV